MARARYRVERYHRAQQGYIWGVRNPECSRYWKSYMWIDIDLAGALRYAILRAGGMNHRDACAQRSKDRKEAA